MKEVFIISTGQIFRGRTAGSQRMLNIARALACGEVKVFLCSFAEIYASPLESYEIYAGIYHLQSQNGDTRNKNHTLSFIRSMSLFMRGRSAERVIYLYPTVFIIKDFLYLLCFKILGRNKIFCDINELRVTNACSEDMAGGIIPKILFFFECVYKICLYKISEFQTLFYDGLVVISTNLQNYYGKYTKRIIRVPILCDTSRIDNLRNITLNENDPFKICFAGYIHCKKEGFDILLEAISKISSQRSIELYLYGILTENNKSVLRNLMLAFGLSENVHYMGNIDPEELLHEFLKYHLLILPRPLTPQTKYGFSTKLSEYLISGVPVLLTDVSDNSLYIKDNYNGFLVKPGSLLSMTEKIKEIIDTYNENSGRIGINALETARNHFDYKLYTESLTSFFFKSMTEENTNS